MKCISAGLAVSWRTAVIKAIYPRFWVLGGEPRGLCWGWAAGPRAWAFLGVPGRAAHPHSDRSRLHHTRPGSAFCHLVGVRGAGAAGGVTKAAQARGWYEAENYLTSGALSRLDKQYSYTLHWSFGCFFSPALNTTAITAAAAIVIMSLSG